MSDPTVVAIMPEGLFAEFFSDTDATRLRAAAARLGGSFVRADRMPSPAFCSHVQIVVTSWGARRFDAAALDRLPSVRMVAHTGASIKAFATDELFDRGVVVTQAGQAMARSVAEVSLAFTLNLLHRVPEMHNALRDGQVWFEPSDVGTQHEIFGATIAVIGASRTGRAYLELIRALGADALLVDPTLTAEAAGQLDAELVPLDDAMRRAQIIAVHAPTLAQTHHMIGRRELRLMRDGAGLVNTARSWLVDEAALIDELRTGRISAAIDVFDEEPLAANSPLRTLRNVVLTPHRAAGTKEGRLRQGNIVTSEVEAFVAGRSLTHAIDRSQRASMA